MIHYMVGKLAPNSSHLTRGLVKHVSGRGYFRTVPSQNVDKILISPPPLIVEPVISTYPSYSNLRLMRGGIGAGEVDISVGGGGSVAADVGAGEGAATMGTGVGIGT